LHHSNALKSQRWFRYDYLLCAWPIHIYICTCVCIHTHIYIHACIYMFIHMYSHLYICTYIYMYLHIHIYTLNVPKYP